jgi:hypothetical protein
VAGVRERGRLEGNVAPLLKLEAPERSFGRVATLRVARCELEAGSGYLSPCGGDGAGESTSLSALMRIYRRHAGKTWRSGREVERRSPAEVLRMRVPSGGFACLRRIAAAAAHLASDGGDLINDVDLFIDSGYIIIWI